MNQPQTGNQLQTAAPAARRQCRHVHTSGHRCQSPTLRQEDFCYFHHQSRRPVAKSEVEAREGRKTRHIAFDLPRPEDRSSIQAAIGEIVLRLAANQLDPRRAGLLLYGLQIASINLPPRQPQADPADTVEAVESHPEHGLIAPSQDFQLHAKKGKDLEQILLEQWARDDAQEAARQAEEAARPVESLDQILETLQAVAQLPHQAVILTEAGRALCGPRGRSIPRVSSSPKPAEPLRPEQPSRNTATRLPSTDPRPLLPKFTSSRLHPAYPHPMRRKLLPIAAAFLVATASAQTAPTLYTYPGSFTPLYTLVNSAKKTIDMTMYELVDTTFSGDLVAACKRGVKVRVILDQNLEKSSNAAAYKQLNATPNCTAVYANPAFHATHQKSFIVDGLTVAILTANLTTRFYPTSRDFALVETNAADIAAIQATFNADFKSTTDFSYQPTPGAGLIWSPTTATADLLGIINGATKTLLLENEEMGAANVVSALEAACKRGVAVHIAMTDTGTYDTEFKALVAAGCGVHTYADSTTGLYIHAKVMIADFGLATQKVYVGSINFTTASMTQNRELGLYVTDATTLKSLNTTLTADYAGASAFSAKASHKTATKRP